MDKLDPITDEAIKVLWDDNMEPEITGITKTYHVGMPVEKGSSPVWAEVKVYEHDYCELDKWLFFGHRPKRDGTGYFLQKPEDAIIWEAMTHVWKWLEEWEYVELRSIGPDDKEYFALPKLTEGEVKSSGYPG